MRLKIKDCLRTRGLWRWLGVQLHDCLLLTLFTLVIRWRSGHGWVGANFHAARRRPSSSIGSGKLVGGRHITYLWLLLLLWIRGCRQCSPISHHICPASVATATNSNSSVMAARGSTIVIVYVLVMGCLVRFNHFGYKHSRSSNPGHHATAAETVSQVRMAASSSSTILQLLFHDGQIRRVEADWLHPEVELGPSLLGTVRH